MSVATLEALEKDFTPNQARALTRLLEAEAAANRAELATKADLALLRGDLTLLSQEVRAALAQQAQELKTALAQQGHDLKNEMAALRTWTAAEIRDAKVDGMRFTVLTMSGQVAMLAGIVYFLLETVR